MWDQCLVCQRLSDIDWFVSIELRRAKRAEMNYEVLNCIDPCSGIERSLLECGILVMEETPETKTKWMVDLEGAISMVHSALNGNTTWRSFISGTEWFRDFKWKTICWRIVNWGLSRKHHIVEMRQGGTVFKYSPSYHSRSWDVHRTDSMWQYGNWEMFPFFFLPIQVLETW